MNFEQLKAACSKTIDIDVPTFNGTIRIKMLTASAGMKLADMVPKSEAGVTLEAMLPLFIELIAKSMLDDDGNTAYDTPEGRALIAQFPVGVLTSIGQTAMELNGLSSAPAEKKS